MTGLFVYFSAILILVISGISCYYAVALKTVYDDMSGEAPATEPPAGESKPQNPA